MSYSGHLCRHICQLLSLSLSLRFVGESLMSIIKRANKILWSPVPIRKHFWTSPPRAANDRNYVFKSTWTITSGFWFLVSDIVDGLEPITYSSRKTMSRALPAIEGSQVMQWTRWRHIWSTVELPGLDKKVMSITMCINYFSLSGSESFLTCRPMGGRDWCLHRQFSYYIVLLSSDIQTGSELIESPIAMIVVLHDTISLSHLKYQYESKCRRKVLSLRYSCV